MNKIQFLTAILSLGVSIAFAQTNTFPNTGNVGIGTMSPTESLDVNGNLNVHAIKFNSTFGHSTIRPNSLLSGQHDASKRQLTYEVGSNQDASTIQIRAGSTANVRSHIRLQGDWSGTRRDGSGGIYFGPNGTDQHVMLNNGNVGIGTVNPQAKLSVDGNILAKEMKIKTDITVPDYVFEPDYKILSLREIESFVKEHKHLPEIPSASVIAREGLDVAEMNFLLLKKIEELTLHVIEQNKQINDQNARLNLMEAKASYTCQ